MTLLCHACFVVLINNGGHIILHSHQQCARGFWTTNPPVSKLGVDPGPADFPARATVAGGSVTLRLPLLSLHECSNRQGYSNHSADCGGGEWHRDNCHPVLSSMETVPVVSECYQNQVIFLTPLTQPCWMGSYLWGPGGVLSVPSLPSCSAPCSALGVLLAPLDFLLLNVFLLHSRSHPYSLQCMLIAARGASLQQRRTLRDSHTVGAS